ncbi:MAG: hypothetical protein K8R77_16335 [Anaerolineaceae bacterium]|nr:hypothetical protein [Anaerolineaceae bacterium]
MNNNLRAQIYSRLILKDTEELLEIWQSGDTTEWIDEVFEIAEEILTDRLGELPSRSDEIQVKPETRVCDEAVIHTAFEESSANQHLDQAIEYAWNDEPEKALQECEAAKPIMPDSALAYNYLGITYDTLGQVEPAIDAYIKAVQLNPRFSAARQNLRNARVRLEEEQYHRAANLSPEETQALSIDFDQFDDAEITEDEAPIPGWFYLDETAFLLTGWPGHRIRPGRSGYDPLESDFELAHMEGVIIRRLFTRTLRTRNPVHLFFMTFVGIFFCFPLLFGVVMCLQGDFFALFPMILFTPYPVVGIAFLTNVVLSLQLEDSSEPDNGCTFF